MFDFLKIGPTLLAEIPEPETHTALAVRTIFYIVLLLAIIFGLMSVAKQGLKERVFKSWITSCFEQIYLFIENLCINTIGAHGRKYVPMIMTLWMVIFFGNLLALCFPYSPTADLSFNLGMAILSIVYVQYEGIRMRGPIGHLTHFTGPKLTGAMVIISGMIFVVEIISELMKNLSLSLRLYGNIHGGHIAVEQMNKLGNGVYIPLGEFLMPIKLLTVVVQPLIFTLLTCVYLSLATHHDDDHDEHTPAHDARLAAQH